MKRSIAAVLIVASLLGGCAGATSLSTDVTRFHQLPSQGGTVAIVAPDPRKSGTAAFNSFASQAASRLAQAGFHPATGAPPDFIAQLDYFQQPVVGGSDDGPRMSIGIGGSNIGRHSGVGVGVGTSFELGGNRDQDAIRTVTLTIERRDNGARVFEGRAQSRGPASDFAAAVPIMIDAIFSNFPGENGKTITVPARGETNR